jgi:hypothetical protein
MSAVYCVHKSFELDIGANLPHPAATLGLEFPPFSSISSFIGSLRNRIVTRQIIDPLASEQKDFGEIRVTYRHQVVDQVNLNICAASEENFKNRNPSGWK